MFKKKRADFLVIGAQKCGTSSLYQYLTANLLIEPALRKEIHFFDLHYSKGKKWYHHHFKFSKSTITGESTPVYMMYENAAKRAFRYNPGLKIIAILRDPVERAISHYRMSVANAMEPLNFGEAIRKEEQRLGDFMNIDSKDSPWLWHSYKRRGLYADQLDRWYDAFPDNQIMLINYHNFFKAPWNNIQRVYDFLDVAPYFGTNIEFRENTSEVAVDVKDEDIAYLKSYFSIPNKELADKYGINFE